MARKYPAIAGLLAVVAGIVIADTIDFASWIFLLAALSLLPLLVYCYTARKMPAAGAAGLGVLLLISAYNYAYRMRTFPPGHVIHFADTDKICNIFGTVDDWPVITENRTSIFLTVDSLECGGRRERSQGRLLLRINTETTSINYGDRIFFSAAIYSPGGGKNPVGLDYRRYLNLKSVFGICYLPNQYNMQVDPAGYGHAYRLIDRMRRFILEAFRESLSREASAMAAGFMVGYTRDISTEVYGYFRDSGTLHLLAVSGSNVGLVLILFVFLLRASPMRLPLRTIILLLIIIIFSFLAYNQPSVVRASVMASLVLIGRALQRRIDLNNIIATAAMIILLFKPGDLFDVGFQLSFVTAWGLVFFVPMMTKPFRDHKTRWYYKYMIFPLIICFTAQVVSLPLSVYYFQRLPVIAFLSNLVIVPLVSIIVIGELVLLLGYLLLPYVGIFIGGLLDPLMRLTLAMLEFFGAGGFGLLFKYDIPGSLLFLYYILLYIFTAGFYSRFYRRLAVLIVLMAANIMLLIGMGGDNKTPYFVILSVPGGIVSVNQAGAVHLVISDPAPKDYLITEKIVVPYLESKSIEPDELCLLSADYNGIAEACYLLDKYDSLLAYIPLTARNICTDISMHQNVRLDTTRVRYYNETPYPADWSGYKSVLCGRTLVYEFDSCMIIFAGNHAEGEWLTDLIKGREKKCVLVKSRVDVEDLNRMAGAFSQKIQLIICNQLTSKAAQLAEYRRRIPGEVPKLVETSQVGAIELVVINGRVEIRNKKIRIIDG
ncbi:MAG: ComEC/Rec2 family competence protein [Candidatus Zixiibacteriota bacterium]